jgi:hypothetical protein
MSLDGKHDKGEIPEDLQENTNSKLTGEMPSDRLVENITRKGNRLPSEKQLAKNTGEKPKSVTKTKDSKKEKKSREKNHGEACGAPELNDVYSDMKDIKLQLKSLSGTLGWNSASSF